MKLNATSLFAVSIVLLISISFISGGCGQIGQITGGSKDTLAPVLIKATPTEKSTNVFAKTVVLEFNEYIDVQDLQSNLIISPLQNRNPTIVVSPRSLNIKFRDTLLQNTTYTINFGNAIRDVNEGNVLKNLNYIFSTGNSVDSMSLAGKVLLAETGLPDSTIIVLLYRYAVDSTVKTKRPNYIAKVNSEGAFNFANLPADTFKIYALKDGDGGKTYNSLSEIFAFNNVNINTAENNSDINLFAYAEKKEDENKLPIPNTIKPKVDKKLRFKTNLQASQDLLLPLEIDFNNPLKFIDSAKIYISDTFFTKLQNVQLSLDSTAKKITLNTKWLPNMPLVLIVEKDAVKDSADVQLLKNDTLNFTTKRIEDYGKLVLRFNDIDLNKNPVIQFLVGNDIKYSYPITTTTFTNTMFTPGEYTVNILYDTDKNGVFTTGNYSKKLQPEFVVTLPQKLQIKADWDNEREINL